MDADESTMAVPLLDGSTNNNNNNKDDYDYESALLHHGDGDGVVVTPPTTPTAMTCRCAVPGFAANLGDKSTREAKLKILFAISLTCIFMIIEFLGGYIAGSLAIMTDAAHLASDCISFVIGLVAIWLGNRAPDDRMSFGYKRMEVVGAIVSILGIWILTATLVAVALQRIYSNDYDLEANTMMIISAIGILINIVMIFVLHGSSLLPGAGGAHGHCHSHGHGHAHSHLPNDATRHTQLLIDDGAAAADGHDDSDAELLVQFANGNGPKRKGSPQPHAPTALPVEERNLNLNLRAAMIHVIGDLVQSVGVFLAAILIKFYPNAKFADPLCTLLFSVIVIMTTVRLFKESVYVLMDAVPQGVSLPDLEMDLSHIEGVKSVHHLNVWNHTANHPVLMAHLVIDFLSDSNAVLQQATRLASGGKYNMKHCTIQIERLSP